MITVNGILGSSALATVLTLTTLCLVLPTFTTSEPGPEFSTEQLAFAAVASAWACRWWRWGRRWPASA